MYVCKVFMIILMNKTVNSFIFFTYPIRNIAILISNQKSSSSDFEDTNLKSN